MIEKLKLIHNNPQKVEPVFLHPNIIDILFEHRRYVKNIFLQIKNHYEIAYFGINIINPSNKLVSFSSMPHIEYNLIHQGLWNYEPSFSAQKLSPNTWFWFDELDVDNQLFEQIKQIKLTSNHFSFGMTLSRKIDGFTFLYSYATSSDKKNLKEYYEAQLLGLIDIGDYFCNSILNLYSEYCDKHTLPKINQLNSKIADFKSLKLVVNNL